MKTLLEAIDVTKVYGAGKLAVPALRGVSLRVDAGEMLAVMGPSGCGKSSLMHILGAMAQPTDGQVLVEGQNLADMDDRSRTAFRRDKIGFVFQKFNLLPTLSARLNIRLARRIQGSHEDPEVEQRLGELLELLQIQDLIDRRPSELSGGEQQRVAIARAVVKHPAIILADEPTGNLDSENSDVVLEMFRELNERLGQTIILVTHNPDLTSYTNRVVHMVDGRITEDTTSDDAGKGAEPGPELIGEAVAGEPSGRER